MNHTAHRLQLFLSCLDNEQVLCNEVQQSSPLTAASLWNRSAYKKLLQLLGECGQAEITSLEAD